MKTNWKAWLGGFVLLALLPASLLAVNVVYTNNDGTSANSVSAYAVDTNGAVSLIASYPTGGTGTGGGFYASNRIIVINNFLFASNAGSNNVSAFTIDSTTGALTAVAGSPFATGGYNNSGESGISLAATPDGKYLYAGNSGSQDVTLFSIGSNGALTAVGSPLYVVGTMSSMKVSPNGRFLVLAFPDLSEVAVYSIASNGTLQAVQNSPFSISATATGVDMDCASSHVFAGLAASNSVKVYNIDSTTGALTLNSVSPAIPSVSSAQVVQLSPDDQTLYVSNQGAHAVSAFSVASDGTLTLATATPVGTGNQYAYPGGLAINADGTFLFAGDPIPAISVFGAGGSPPLVLDSYFPTGLTYGLHSVAAYPPKVCTLPTTLAASLEISAGPPPSYDLDATLGLGGGGAVDPLTQPVTISIADYSVTIPAGSFNLHQSGTNAGIYVFQGVIGSATLKVQIAALGQNQFQITAFGKQVDLTGVINPVSVQVSIGSNSASTSVTATFPDPLRGLWSAQ